MGKTEGANNVELDLTADGTRSSTTYAGGGGVGVGSFFNKLMYAVKFGDSNFLLSGRVGPDSRVLYYRDPAQRVAKVAPWLTLDSDVYPTVVDGGILWVVDGYTTTDQYPQAQRESFETMTTDSLTQPSGVRTLPTDQVNYVRNAVKATVDAYTGKVTLYAWDESDPILQAWRNAFPDSVQDKDQIPPDLKAHLRYPEDMFKVQRYQFARYHVTDASDFYQGNNQWAVPEDPVRTGNSQTPIRMYSRDPQTGQSVWSLVSNYVPRNKSNLVGVVAADSDPTSPDYGKILVEEPRQRERPRPHAGLQQPDLRPADHAQDPEVQARRRHHAVRQRRVGAAVVRPDVRRTGVRDAFAADATSYLTLRYVMVQYGDEVGIGNTLVDAISDMANSAPPPDQNPAQPERG